MYDKVIEREGKEPTWNNDDFILSCPDPKKLEIISSIHTIYKVPSR